jgi:phosphohistidine phosphatase
MEAMEGRRTLIVMRHAKAGELPGGPDAERALSERGWRDGTAAGMWLAERDFIPDTVICSSARRTRQTWQQVSAELAAQVNFSADPALYQADVGDLLSIIALTVPEVSTLMYIGHNPAAGQLAAGLTGTELDFPTAAIAVLDLPGSWDDLAPGSATLTASWTPRTT